MTTDLGANRVVVFGGYAGSSYLGDTWLFDGVTWAALAGTSPPARMRCAMAYDEVRGASMMYGGINGVSVSSWLAGTWEFANGAWSQRTSAHLPPRRFGHAMAYDAVHARIVMFGGRTNSGTIFLQDTWQWDGTDWTPFLPASSPSPRMGHAMAFDPTLGQVVLFGGLQLGGPFVGDTWSWNGTTWTHLAPANAPSPRADLAMATDPERGCIVLQGGYDGTDLTDTFEWHGSNWVPVVTAPHPGVLALAGLATGPAGRHVVLFGGDDLGAVHAETWYFGFLPRVRTFGVGCGLPPLTLTATSGDLPVLGQAFHSEVSAVPAGGLPFLALGLSATIANGVPLPIDLTPLGMNGCWLYQELGVLGLGCTPAGSIWTNTINLPGQPSAAGVDIFAQAYALAPGSNALGLLTSNALGLTLGQF